MKSTLTLQLDSALMVRLNRQLNRREGNVYAGEAIAIAIAFWLDAAAPDPGSAAPAAARGYQWKSVFLPHGTELRSWSYGEHNYARVEGDQIIHEGRSVSPNQFAQAFARSTRNAWTDLFIRRPGDKKYTLACRLREILAQQEQPSVSQEQSAQAAPAVSTEPSAPAPPPMPTAPADAASLALTTLLSHLAAVTQALQAETEARPAPTPSSLRTPALGDWHVLPGGRLALPERRQWRNWIDDPAFDS